MKKIDKTIHINGMEYAMEERSLLEGAISIMLPIEFRQLDSEAVNEKYQMSFNPQTVLTDNAGVAHFSFNLLNETVDDMEVYIAKIKSGIKLIYPKTIFYEEGHLCLDDVAPYFDFKNDSLDEPIYNLMYLIKLQNDTLLGAFNCPDTQAKIWQPVVKDLLNTIKVL